MLTEEQKAKYVKGGGYSCPYCGSDDITAGAYDWDGSGVCQVVTCGKCDKEWTDVYTLTAIEEAEE